MSFVAKVTKLTLAKVGEFHPSDGFSGHREFEFISTHYYVLETKLFSGSKSFNLPIQFIVFKYTNIISISLPFVVSFWRCDVFLKCFSL